MRLGNRVTPAVSRWRATLADENVLRRVPVLDAPAIEANAPAIRLTLDQALAAAVINHPERDSLAAILSNPGRDPAEGHVLMLTIAQLRGLPVPASLRVLT